jgi:hypothetical protein
VSDREFVEEEGGDDVVPSDWGPDDGEVRDALVRDGQPVGFADWFEALPDDRRAMLSLDGDRLQLEFTHATGRYAYWFERYARAEEAHERAHGATKLARAKARLAVVLEANGKKPAKDVLDAMVDAHPDVLAAEDREHAARREYRRWQGDVEALRQRRDYLVQLGARSRAEGLREPVIRQPEEKDGEKR